VKAVDPLNGVRPNTGDAYRDGRGMFVPREVRVRDGERISGDQRIEAEICVIGAGAGGAVVAKELAERGLSVVVLEEGPYVTTDELTARPQEMLRDLYRDAGQTATVGNVPVMLPLGRAVGGTTLINSGTCFRTPAHVLDSWATDFDVPLDAAELDPYYRRAERVLNVAQIPPDLAGRNAAVVKRGADALGWSNDFLFRNARGCVGSGVCTFGCPASAKQHTAITFMARAWDDGAWTYSSCKVVRLEQSRGRVTEVVAKTRGGGTVTVAADHVVLAAGTIGTPPLLAAARIGDGSGELGRNLSIHPASAVLALLDEVVQMAVGVPQSLYVDEFADERIMLEGAAGPPAYASNLIPLVGAEHRDVMLRYENLSQFGVMVSDISRGHLILRGPQPVIRYDMCDEDVQAMARGVKLLARIYVEAGAKRLFLPFARLSSIDVDQLDRLDAFQARSGDFKLMAFHPLGTTRMHGDPRRGVVDGDLRVHGCENVHVADGGVVPSSLGVNPQLTIMAIATRLAYHLAGAPAPTEEPVPEKIPIPLKKEAAPSLS
jgi:choline dehydrogenase-like flavoprotein